MADQKKQLPIQRNRADINTASYNEQDGTIEVVFATQEPVLRAGWDGTYYEVLVCDKTSIRSARLDNGNICLVDTHDTWSVENVIGRVISWDVQNGQCTAVIKLSTRQEVAGIISDIKAGVLKGISVGYRVYKMEAQPQGAEETITTYRITDWEPMEVSLVAMPADMNSMVRNASNQTSNEVTVIDHSQNNRSQNMKRNNAAGTNNQQRNADGENSQPNNAGNNGQQQNAGGENAGNEEGGEGETENNNGGENSQPNNAGNNGQQQNAGGESAGNEEGGERSAQPAALILRSVINAGLEPEFAETLLSRGVTVERAVEIVLAEQAKRSNTNNVRNINPLNASARGDERTQKREAMILGLMHRAQPGSIDMAKPENQGAHDYRYMRMLDLAKECLTANGERNVNRMNNNEIYQRAIATTDFADLLTSTTSRFLRRYYEAVVPDWQAFARQENADDFRVKTGVKVDANVTYEELAEGGEYKESKIMSNEKATIQLKTYARKFSISRIAVINDDLSVLTRFPQWMALGARQMESQKVWGNIINNVAAPDGNALFHSSHSNLASGTDKAAPTDTLLSKGRAAMRRQKSPEGNILGIVPKFLLVPAELQTTAEKLVTSVQSTATSDVNIWANRLQPVVVDWFTDVNAWYLAADPNAIMADGLVYSYLNGQEGLFTDSYIDKDTDNIVYKGRLDFATAVWGWQGWYKNPGA